MTDTLTAADRAAYAALFRAKADTVRDAIDGTEGAIERAAMTTEISIWRQAAGLISMPLITERRD